MKKKRNVTNINIYLYTKYLEISEAKNHNKKAFKKLNKQFFVKLFLF